MTTTSEGDGKIEASEQTLHPDIAELGTLLRSDRFLADFVTVQTKPQQDAIEKATSALDRSADIAVHKSIPERAAAATGLSSDHVKAVKARMKAIADGKNKSGYADLEETADSAAELIARWDRTIEATKTDVLEHLPELVEAEKKRLVETEGSAFQTAIDSALQNLDVQRARHTEEVRELREQFEQYKDSPELAEALNVWGRSPDASGDFGPDGNGFNAGVIHFFAYRADAEKNTRFSKWLQPTIDTFISYSQYLKSLLDAPVPSKGSEVTFSGGLSDTDGNIRLILITKHHEEVIAFSRHENPGLKVITVLPGKDRIDAEKDLEKEKNGEDGVRLNDLGSSPEYIDSEVALERSRRNSNN